MMPLAPVSRWHLEYVDDELRSYVIGDRTARTEEEIQERIGPQVRGRTLEFLMRCILTVLGHCRKAKVPRSRPLAPKHVAWVGQAGKP